MLLNAGCDLILQVFAETELHIMLQPRRHQSVVEERLVTSKPLVTAQMVDAFGNAVRRLIVPAGELRISSSMRVIADERVAVARRAHRTDTARLPDSVLQYTRPSRYCPSDKLERLASQIIPRQASGYEQVQAVRDFVHAHIEYRYGVSDWTTDAQQTLAARAGVCRDFAHVAIALCRAIGIPARMAAGYLHGLAPMDLHAWFEAFVGDRWYTFDAAEDRLLGGRIVLAYGRDAGDVAFLSGYRALQLQHMRVWVERLADDEQPAHAALAG